MKKRVLFLLIALLIVSVVLVGLVACDGDGAPNDVMKAAEVGWDAFAAKYIYPGSDWTVNSISYAIYTDSNNEKAYIFKVNWQSTYLGEYYSGDVYMTVMNGKAYDSSYNKSLYETVYSSNEHGDLSKNQINKLTKRSK